MELKSDEIKKIIPHRYPFLLIDKVTDMKPGEWVRGDKMRICQRDVFYGTFSAETDHAGSSHNRSLSSGRSSGHLVNAPEQG